MTKISARAKARVPLNPNKSYAGESNFEDCFRTGNTQGFEVRLD